MKVGPVTGDIPAAVVREVGRVMTRHANLHNHVKRTTYLLLNLDSKMGRCWVRDPKLAEHISMMEATVKYRKFKVSTDFTNLRTLVEKVTSERDKLAHCPWVLTPSGELKLQYIKEKWTPPGTKGKTSRWLVPQGLLRPAEHVRQTVAEIDEATQTVLRLQNELKELPLAWPHTLGKPGPQSNHNPDRNPIAP